MPKKFKNDFLYSFVMPENNLDDEGIRLLNDNISSLIGSNIFDELSNSFEYVWVNRQGTLPKRLSRYLYNNYKIKLTQKDLTEIGNIGRKHSQNEKLSGKYYFDVTHKICTWERGAFGSWGSCYYSDNINAPKMLETNGALCLRFFTTTKKNAEHSYLYYNKFYSYGRAWLIPNTPNTNTYILFNGYGYELLEIIRIFSAWLGLSYRKINLYNNDSDCNELYINGGLGYIVGLQKDLQIDSYDLCFPEISSLCCVNCEEAVFASEAYNDDNNDYWCNDCYCQEHSECCICCNMQNNDNICNYDDDSYCSDCFDNKIGNCAECDEQFKWIDLTQHKDEYFCDDCIEDIKEKEEKEKEKEKEINKNQEEIRLKV